MAVAPRDWNRISEGLQGCASGPEAEAERAALIQWQEAAVASEHVLGTAILSLATGLLQSSNTLEVREQALLGLESCLSVAARNLVEDSYERLKASVLERTLRHFDAAGQVLAQKASLLLLFPGQEPAQSTAALLAMFTLLCRCVGLERLSAQDLLDLTQGDVALAVATLVEGLRSPAPAGLHGWGQGLAVFLRKLAGPDAFMWLLQRAEPHRDFNNVPVQETWQLQRNHAHVIAQALLQFDGFGALLTAAEVPDQRAAVLDATLRLLLALVGSRGYGRSGRLLSRWMALEFSRFGYRFVAPVARKLVEDSRTIEAGHSIRRICQVFSWLVVHAEADDSRLLAASMRPLATEWASRAASHAAPGHTLSALLALAANVGAFDNDADTAASALIRPAAERLHALGQQDGGVLQRWRAFTSSALESLQRQGFHVLALDDLGWELEEEDETAATTASAEFQIAQSNLPAEDSVNAGGADCSDCGKTTQDGAYGEGYYAGVWFCAQCWSVWYDAEPTRAAALSLWPLEAGLPQGGSSSPQCGAAACLLLAPSELRCGVSGALLTGAACAGGMAVRIPSSTSASFPVAYMRRPLEQWHRRSKGKDPLTGEDLDMRYAVEATDVYQAVRSWLSDQLRGGQQ